jgi:hypothetical protein
MSKFHMRDIIKLEDDNYTQWKAQTKNILIKEGEWAIVCGRSKRPVVPDPPQTTKAAGKEKAADFDDAFSAQVQKAMEARDAWDTSAESASATIQLCLGPKALGRVSHIDHGEPKLMWDEITKMYGTTGFSGRYHAFRRLIRCELGDRSCSEYVHEIKTIAQELADSSRPIYDDFLIAILVSGLPPSYESFVAGMINGLRLKDSQDLGPTDLKMVIDSLFDEEKRKELDKVTGSSAFSAGRRSISCSHCNKAGHGVDKCWEKHPELRPKKFGKKKGSKEKDESDDEDTKNSTAPSANPAAFRVWRTTAFMARSAGGVGAFDWLLDTCASDHMARSRMSFDEGSYTPIVGKVQVANGELMDIVGQGTVTLDVLLFGRQPAEVKLLNVLHTPDVPNNLISYTQMMATGKFTSQGDKQGIVVRRKADGQVVLTTTSTSGMLLVPRKIPKAFAAAATEPSKSLALWHARMGHLNQKDVISLTGQKLENDLPEVCQSCVYGKQHRTPSHMPMPRAKEALELIHSDVEEISPMAYGGYKYFVQFTDDYTRMTFGFLLKHKNEVLQKFKEFRRIVEKDLKKKIRRLRADNGLGEYTNKEFEDYRKKHGITFEPTIPYGADQNGVSERGNRTIVTRAKAMVHCAGLSKQWWGAAVITAIYLKNRSPTKGLPEGKTPFEMWHGHPPDLRNIRVFGCVAYNNVPKVKRTQKMDSESRRCIFIGYAGGHNQWRLYDVESKTITVGRDVIFDETSVCCPSRNDFIDFDKPSKTPLAIHTKFHTIQSSLEGEAEKQPTSSDQPSLVEEENSDSDSDSSGVEEHVEDILPPQRLLKPAANAEFHRRVSARSNKGLRAETFQEEAARRNFYSSQAMAVQGKMAAIHLDDIVEPKSWPEAMRGPQKQQWFDAALSEWESLNHNGTFDVVHLKDLSADAVILDCKWVFKIKRTEHGEIEKYKARLVGRGDRQSKGVNYEETFAPVAKYMSIRLLEAVKTLEDLACDQMDFVAAYLNGDLKEVIYMSFPPGFEVEGAVLLLRKTLYGLKQSACEWYRRYREAMVKLGYQPIASDHSLFASGDKKMLIPIYVDDLLIYRPLSHQAQCSNLKTSLGAEFKMTDKGEPAHYLGMKFERQSTLGLSKISQPRHIEQLLAEFGMQDSNPVATPMDPATFAELLKPSKPEGLPEPLFVKRYQSAIGSLMYIAMGTRPDIAFAVGVLSRFLTKPQDCHWIAAKRVMRYLRGTSTYGIVYRRGGGNLLGYVDAAYGDCHDTRRSTAGYVFLLGGGAVSWKSRRQQTVALSTVEAEYMGATQSAKEAVWERRLLTEIGRLDLVQYEPSGHRGTVLIRTDNQGALDLAKNPEFHDKTKHIDIQQHWIREVLASKKITLQHVPTTEQVADIFTKPLPRVTFEKFRWELGLREDLE